MEGSHRLKAERAAQVEDGLLSGPSGPVVRFRRWFALHHGSVHLLALVLVAGCATATWWQVGRALSGNGLSWAYVFEWPFFGGYAIFMWRKLLREAQGRPPWRVSPDSWLAVPPPTPAEEHAEAEALWAYNRYLAELALADRALEMGRRRRLRPAGDDQPGSPASLAGPARAGLGGGYRDGSGTVAKTGEVDGRVAES